MCTRLSLSRRVVSHKHLPFALLMPTEKPSLRWQAQYQNEQVYLPVDAVRQVIDPATTHQYNHPRQRLTLKTKDRQIRLQMGRLTVSIDPGGQTVTLSTPPIIIAQQPMLPIDFFTQLLPILNDVEVIYNSSLNRLQIRPKDALSSVETSGPQDLVIIVDPGHGGPDDRGCAGSTGILEKDIVLALAKQLQWTSEQHGLQLHLTRETDTKKTHFQRIQVAKQNRGQLLLSLHCNTSFSPYQKGIRISSIIRGSIDSQILQNQHSRDNVKNSSHKPTI